MEVRDAKIITLVLSILILIAAFTACINDQNNNFAKYNKNPLLPDSDQSATNKNDRIGDNDLKKAALISHVYPQMAQYPNEMYFIDTKTGEFDDKGFEQVYDAWKADRN